MKIKHIIEKFKLEDLSKWNIIRNREKRALWVRNSTNQLKIHIKKREDEYEITFFEFNALNNFNGVNTRVIINSKELIGSETQIVDNVDGFNESTLVLENYVDYQDESNFFQESLIKDFGDLAHEDLVDLINLRNEVIEKFGEHVNVNS